MPGNVRELRNTLERAVVLSPTDLIEEIYGLNRDLPEVQNTNQTSENLSLLSLAEIEKRHILRVLSEVNGKREKAAAILGITSRTLYRKLNEFDGDNSTN